MRYFALFLAAAFTLGAAAPKPIFNGRNLDGWSLVGGKGPGYVVEDGVLVCPADGGGNLFTDRDYTNFVFRFEFKMAPGGNNGVGIRAPLSGDVAYSGMEIQILDHNDAQYKGKIKPEQHHGSVYDLIASTAENFKPLGEWNTEEIKVDGRRVVVTLNGKMITNADLKTITDPAVLKKHPGVLRESGRIGFLGHGTRVEFRNITVEELP